MISYRKLCSLESLGGSVWISWFMSSSPESGSVLTAQSLEPASDSVSPSLSAPPLPTLSLSLKNKHLKKKQKDTHKVTAGRRETMWISGTREPETQRASDTDVGHNTP